MTTNRSPYLSRQHKTAFTLIELLIVVAIVAILALIAVPNFLEAQTRAKVSRAKADLRTLAVALDAYQTDHNAYPYPLNTDYNGFVAAVTELTTPTAYLSSGKLVDPFKPEWTAYGLNPPAPSDWQATYLYYNYAGWYFTTLPSFLEAKPFAGYCIASVGPDRHWETVSFLPLTMDDSKHEKASLAAFYDPSNGTVSRGDIARWTGKLPKFGAF